ncbi:MAG TPA: RNA polymerase sigma-54 factor [Candidatus Cloacimonetes bacterium]|nr:RNA polymerase sigma-54 factor [Candidatus Cloacimonadota bacterium]
MNKLKQSLSFKLTQNLLLKPKMLQSLEMLAMPLMQLETHLKQELVTNPMLEIQELREDDESEENSSEKEETSKKEEASEDLETADTELEKTLKESQELSEILDSWNELYTDRSYKISNEEKVTFEQILRAQDNKKRDFFDQLDKLKLTENEYDFGFELIDSVNIHGFLPEDFSLYLMAEEYEISEQRADEIHNLILNFHPKGITARNIQECLKAQLDNKIHSPQLFDLIEYDFCDLIHKRYKKIASKYGVTLNTVINWKNQISHLDPKPGLRIQSGQSDYIVPDVIIKKIGNEYEIISNDFTLPRIRMSRHYQDILRKVGKDRQAVDYVRNKINSAKFLIKSVYLRSRTLERVVRAIIRNQVDFFYQDSGVLRPLTYSVIAEELQVNESTISRVVKNKYADTPFGIMCLKDFFSSTAGKDNNYNSISRQNVETIVKKMIDNEDSSNPLSDQDIVDNLTKQGINVSRRVVAKYRKSMGILNSHLRRSE